VNGVLGIHPGPRYASSSSIAKPRAPSMEFGTFGAQFSFSPFPPGERSCSVM
jgi:hypothetical protein